MWRVHERIKLGNTHPRAFATRASCSCAYAGLMWGSSPLPLAVTASAGTTGTAGAVPRTGVITPSE